MKKRVRLLVLFIVFGIGGMLFLALQGRKTWLQVEENNQISVKIIEGSEQKTLYSWLNETEGREYFFLPAFVDYDIYVGSKDKEIYINGKRYYKGERLEWENDSIYKMEIYDGKEHDLICSHDIVFMKSENIPSVFIETDSGSMSMINDDYQESGSIDIILSEGQVEYSGKLEKISLRGNSTRGYPKKPYSIKLKDAKPLCGMTEGKKWNLLAGWREGTKMNDKLVYDMADAIGLENSISSTWVDLYLNGEYNGIYLLCESISVENELEEDNEAINPNIEMAETFEYLNMKGFEIEDGHDITGGYLLEKEFSLYYEEEENGFITDAGNHFVIKSPQYASKRQVEYIRNYFQKIEDLIMERDPEYLKYLDLDGFTKRFLIDEISLNFDTGITSMYFYKESGNDILYAGPVWDYDTALGSVAPKFGSGETWNSYEYSVLETETGLRQWYQILYKNDEFYNEMVINYTNLLPYMDELINSKIDQYAMLIESSVKMNDVRWKDQEPETEIVNAGHYLSFEANVKYLKYFLAKRLNFLNKRWGVEYTEFSVPSSGEIHKVVFEQDGKQDVMWVKDGMILKELPYLNVQEYDGWYFSYSNEKYFDKLPIYEDVVLCARKRQ